MPSIDVSLSISPEEWIKLYRGEARDVFATARDGRRVRFPARILSPFFLETGIHGHFRIIFTEEGRFDRIERL